MLVFFCQSVHFALQMLIFEPDLPEFIDQHSVVLSDGKIPFVRAFEVAGHVAGHVAERIFNIVG